ncbi:transmembrane protein 231-like [Brevipalpus obovatus]|uniref:transmembrane protein 231-like n=1 Tax=Brevipalpus obovatus TaxID=246614 RepID=UPI003D9FA258
MSQITVLTRNIQIKYLASKFSKASFYSTILWIINILYPWMIVYHSDGLWRRVELYWEQPDVHFRFEIISLIHVSNSSVPGGKLFWTSCNQCNSRIDQRMIRVPSITNFENDLDEDGKYDEFHMNLRIPVEKNEDITGVQLFLFFNYKLQEKVNFQMDSLIYLEKWTNVPASSITFLGDIKFNQKEPLSAKNFPPKFLNFHGEIEEKLDLSKVNEILTHYHRKRSYSTTLSPSSLRLVNYANDPTDDDFQINVQLKYVNDLFQYTPSIWFMVKWAWIQYFSVFIVAYLIVRRIKVWIFDNRLADTLVVMENYAHKYVSF